VAVGVSTSGVPSLLAGRYRLLAPVGRGAIAEVVRARDEQRGAEVALKILYPHLRESAAVVERFRREVDIVRRISHPHVLAIREVVDSDGQLFLVMDYHPGGDLADRLAGKRALSAGELRVLAAQLCGALAAAHRAGVVHRDVKPSNVLCGPGPGLDVRLCDFGLARTAELSGLTTANAVLGTPEYMAPEVVVDGHADPRSDVYSLGVMLFEAATGRLPFYGDSPYQLMRQHVDAEAPRARSLASALPAAIDDAIARALAKDPLDRFSTCEDLARAFADEPPAQRSAALAPATAAVAAARRVCPQCGGWLVEAAGVCADCGAALLRLEDAVEGGVSVLVLGPGKAGDKIDARRHVALFEILDELPVGRVPIGRGRRRAPRVPFFVARGLTERSATELAGRLNAIGLDARVQTGSALAHRGMRAKVWEMNKRRTVGAGVLLTGGPQLVSAWVELHHLFFLIYPIGLVLWAAGLASSAIRHTRPLIDRRSGRASQPAAPGRLADALSRLRSRQDRRLVGRVLERQARVAGLGRGELAQALVERAALIADALANLDSMRAADASVAPAPDRALAELRREEVTRVVLRADLLRVASRLDDLCQIVARAAVVDSADETARLDREIQEIALAVESEQEVAALLGAKE
jgi:tRNA A-37 threonylcarbamoyl transferase component Bud32